MVAIVLGTMLGQLRASVVVLLMVTGGEALEDYAMKSANRDVEALLEKVVSFLFLVCFDFIFRAPVAVVSVVAVRVGVYKKTCSFCLF